MEGVVASALADDSVQRTSASTVAKALAARNNVTTVTGSSLASCRRRDYPGCAGSPKRRREAQMPSGAEAPGGFFYGRREDVMAGSMRSGLRVLIAEDESIVRLDLRELLEDQGLFVCGEARNGLEAVALARELSPDVALIDIGMPELDGIEACRRIYAERPIPIVMLTGHSERELVDRALEAGAFSYLVKPFRATDVAPALRAAATRHAELLAARRVIGADPRPLRFHVSETS
jgi:CheY-like chemotaxis protein